MKARKILFLTAVLPILVTGLTRGQGTLVAGHFGANDPLAEGFAISTYGNPQVGGVTNDLGVDAWSMRHSESEVYYTKSLPSLAGLDWTLSVTIRVLTHNVNPAGFAFTTDIRSGTDAFLMSFGSSTNGDPMVRVNGGSHSSPPFVLNGSGSLYHNYMLVYQASTDTAALWIDGSERFNGIIGFAVSDTFMSWRGGYQSPGDYLANWNEVSLSVIPEPSSLVLLCCGGFLLAARRCRVRPSKGVCE